MSLSVSNLVRVTINLSPQAAAARSFGVLMIAGDSDVISGLERFRTYISIEGVAVDFGVDAPEYKAAALYFAQVPQPATVMIGRWLRTASSGENIGGILSANEQLISSWQSISAGSFVIPVDGTPENLSALDFSGASNLNAVATLITSALSGAVCTWNGTNFVIESTSTGDGVKASGTISLDTNPSFGAQAQGTITLSGQPSPGDSVTIKGTAVTFVSGTPTGNQVQISGVDDLGTAANLQAFLQGSADVNLSACIYNTIGLITTITARFYSTVGNSYGLVKSGTNIAVSASTLLGGVNPDTLTVNSTVFTFEALNPVGNQVLVGPTAAATAANLQSVLAASLVSNVMQASYATSGTLTTVTAIAPGTAGNSFTLAKTGSHITVSGATLSGGAVASSIGFATSLGSGTDISALLKMTSSTSQGLVGGYDAESPVECAAVLANKSAAWYGLMFNASVQPTDDQNIDVCDFIEPLDLKRLFGVNISNTNVLSALISTDLASRMKAGGYNQSMCQYSATNPQAIASLFGRAFSVNFSANNTTITLMFKQEPGVVGEDLDFNEALTLQNKRCNVFVDYVNDTVIIQYGVMSGPRYIDETHGLDWLQNAIQTGVYNVLYTSTTKIPQTDAGVNKLVNAIDQVCGQAVANGLVAPGVWNADGFGSLNTGDYLKTGYYIFAQSVALQAQSDREARKSPPIQVAIKLAGAIQSVDILVNVNR